MQEDLDVHFVYESIDLLTFRSFFKKYKVKFQCFPTWYAVLLRGKRFR